MSVKLYNAWRMPNQPMHKFQAWLTILRKNLRELGDKRILSEITRRAVILHDRKIIFPNKIDNSNKNNFAISAWSEVINEYLSVKRTRQRNPLVDVECEILFAWHGRFTYMVMFSEVQDYADALESLPNVQEYRYWDNADKPDTVPQRKWQTRAKTWEAIFQCNSMGQAGLLWSLYGDHGIPLPEEGRIEEYIPTFEQRVKDMVKDVVFQKAPKNLTTDIFTLADWVNNSPEAKQIRKQITPIVKSRLKKIITYEDLMPE